MKSNLKYFILTISVIIINEIGHTQSLKKRLEGVTDFLTIQKESELYYDSIAKGLRLKHYEDLKYKHWKREEYFLRQHLDKDGNIAEYMQLNIDAERNIQRQYENEERSTNSFWEFNGPVGHINPTTSTQYIGKGRVDRIAFHPTDPNIILVGTPAGGIFKTLNGGATWYPVTHNLPSMGISGIAFAKNNSSIVYALTGCAEGMGMYNSAGVLKSIDGGETWFFTNLNSTQIYSGYQLAVNPNNDNVVVVATTKGIAYTSNGGNSWNWSYTNDTFFDVKKDPTDPNRFFGITASYFLRFSINSGGFSGTPTDYFTGGRKGLAISQALPEKVYMLSGPVRQAGVFNGFFSSPNSGNFNSFDTISNTPNIFGGEGGLDNFDQSGYDFCVTVSDVDPNLIITGGAVVNKSTDGGVTWTSITTYGTNSNSPNYVHPDIHDVQINPLNNYLYTATDGGLYVSTDFGDTWTDITNNIYTTQFYHIAGYNSNPDYFAGGCQDNGTKFRMENSYYMDHVSGGDGFCTAFNPIDSTIFYGSTNSGVARYENSGTSIVGISPKSYWFSNVETHVSDGNYVFVGTDTFHISPNQGASWVNIPVAANFSMATCKSLGSKIYVAGEKSGIKKMYRVENLGADTFRIDNKPGFPASKNISDITVHPLLHNFVYLTINGYLENEKVFFSTDGGENWINLSSGLPNIPIHRVAVTSMGHIYIGTEIGVFYKANGSVVWRPFRNGLPLCPVSELIIYESHNLIRAATFGRGVWQSPLGDLNCDASLITNFVTFKGFGFFEASDNIECDGIIKGGFGTDVYLKAGNFIDLKDGFNATDTNTEVRVYIDSCGNGVP